MAGSRKGDEALGHLVGIDVGGTFTDFVAYDAESQRLDVWKTLSTPHDPGEGIVSGLEKNESVGDIEHLRFGTTIATNAVLERKGAHVAYVTTEGFKDVPFIQRGKRQSHYDITWIKSKPLMKRRHCYEVRGRITARGEEYTPLDEAGVRHIAQTIADDDSIDAVAVCLLFSYVTPVHERRVQEIFAELCPDKPISISYDVLPKWKEHERSSTTIADAYIKPLVANHLASLGGRLSERGVNKRLAVIKSNGGEMTLDAAADAPIQLTLSGPTGGVVGAKQVARLAGADHLVTLDMGGTSTDVSTVVSGRESFTTSFEMQFGLPIQIPMIDIRTMGAGGGSLAWIDKGGMLRVGPESAGANPGPACYGQGGTQATATDANVVLGRTHRARARPPRLHVVGLRWRRPCAYLGPHVSRQHSERHRAEPPRTVFGLRLHHDGPPHRRGAHRTDDFEGLPARSRQPRDARFGAGIDPGARRAGLHRKYRNLPRARDALFRAEPRARSRHRLRGFQRQDHRLDLGEISRRPQGALQLRHPRRNDRAHQHQGHRNFGHRQAGAADAAQRRRRTDA
jgi:hypothetical protein